MDGKSSGPSECVHVPTMDQARLRAFGRQVRRLRASRGLSQEALADAAGLDRSYVGGIERGERNLSLTKIHKLAGALGAPVADLFVDEAAE